MGREGAKKDSEHEQPRKWKAAGRWRVAKEVEGGQGGGGWPRR